MLLAPSSAARPAAAEEVASRLPQRASLVVLSEVDSESKRPSTQPGPFGFADSPARSKDKKDKDKKDKKHKEHKKDKKDKHHKRKGSSGGSSDSSDSDSD